MRMKFSGVWRSLSDALLDMWQAPPQEAYEKTGDSYSMYIKIMKSVAEIMNGA